MLGAAGTAVDVEQVSATFKELGFAVLRRENLTSEDLVNLIKAAAAYDYPTLTRFRFFAFYFAGHGGADGNDNLFIDTFPTTADPKPILHIEPYIIEPLKDLTVPCRLFMFDCCQSPGAGQAYRSQEKDSSKKPQKRPQQVIAFAVSKGQKAVGNKDRGGLWTRHLCSNIREKIPLVNVLAKTNGAVRSEGLQDPTFICNIDEIIVSKKETSSNPDTSQKNEASAVVSRSMPEFSVAAVLEYLKCKSANWSEIGQAFGVSLNDRKGLRKDGGLSNEERLETVIDTWIATTGSKADLNWDGFIRVLQNKMKYNDIARKVESDLEK